MQASSLKFATKRLHGFTLMELLTVIAIISILSGIGIGVGGQVMERAKRARSAAEITAIDTALERYKNDYGGYPGVHALPDPRIDLDPNVELYRNASRVLFSALSGRKNFNRKDIDGGIAYMEFQATQVDTESRRPSELLTETYIVDPWGNPYGYNTNSASTGFNQSFFDLWSTGGGSEKTNSWVMNWK